MIKKLGIMSALLMTCCSVYAHGIYFAERVQKTALVYGVGADDLRIVKRLPKITTFKAFNEQWQEVDAELKVYDPMVFVEGKHDALAAVMNNGIWSNTGEGHWIGKGRDEFSRILDGTRFTIFIPLLAALACSTGTLIALFSAVSGPRTDEVISRFMDALISIPSKIFSLVMIAAFGSSVPLLLTITAISYMPGSFRIARALAVNVANMDFVTVARTRGESRLYLAVKEILPNILHPMLADFGLRFVFVVLLLSSLSFLGLGVQPPEADLGSLVRENISGLAEGAPAVIIPAIAIATITIAVNLLIDSLRGGATYAARGK